MAKVIQIRDVPNEVHQILSDEARREGLSMTRYLLRELENLAERRATIRRNTETILRLQEEIGTPASREQILDALDEGRRE